MAQVHGKSGTVKIGTTAIAFIQSFTVDQTVDMADGTSMGEDWEVSLAGLKKWSGSLTCKFDSAIDDGQKLLKIGEKVSLILSPDGNTHDLTGDAFITKRGLSVNRGDIVELSFDFKGDGELTDGTTPVA